MKMISMTIPTVAALALASTLAAQNDSYRDLQDRITWLEMQQQDREWDELEAQRKAEEAKQQAEIEAQQQATMNAYRQQTTPLVQPDTDSLATDLRDLKDEIEQSRLDANFRQYQATLQPRLAAMTPEARAAYFHAAQEQAQQAWLRQQQERDRKQREQDDAICNEEIQVHKWNHQNSFGKTFMIGLFKERRLGDRKADVDAVAKQIGARFYKMLEHHKWGNLEEVKVVFYK
jgi:hypothetical protein